MSKLLYTTLKKKKDKNSLFHDSGIRLDMNQAYRQSAYRQLNYKPSCRLPLLSDRPTVTFPATQHHQPWPVLIYTASQQKHMYVNK